MPRMFELRGQGADGDLHLIVDLDKVCLVRVDKEPGHHFPHVVVRFGDGHEVRGLVPVESAERLIEAYRAYLLEQEQRGRGG
jgi:hypothetical protein